jgi:hypothetical protein
LAAVDSDTARVIFDNKVASQAQRIAAVIHRMGKEDKTSLGGAVRRSIFCFIQTPRKPMAT